MPANTWQPLFFLFASGFFLGISSVLGGICVFLSRQKGYSNALFKTVFYIALLAAIGFFVAIFIPALA
jgi:hypothetical protein